MSDTIVVLSAQARFAAQREGDVEKNPTRHATGVVIEAARPFQESRARVETAREQRQLADKARREWAERSAAPPETRVERSAPPKPPFARAIAGEFQSIHDQDGFAGACRDAFREVLGLDREFPREVDRWFRLVQLQTAIETAGPVTAKPVPLAVAGPYKGFASALDDLTWNCRGFVDQTPEAARRDRHYRLRVLLDILRKTIALRPQGAALYVLPDEVAS